MTLQVHDIIRFEGKDWRLADESGEGFFEPAQFGLSCAGAFSTACWSGYHSTFGIDTGVLQLTTLEINLDEIYLFEVDPPQLNGRKPQKWDWSRWDETDRKASPSPTCGEFLYSNVQLPIAFTGGLLLRQSCKVPLSAIPNCANPIQMLERQQVRELILDKGNLIEMFNRTAVVVAMIADIMQRPKGEFRDSESTRKSINTCFKYNYRC